MKKLFLILTLMCFSYAGFSQDAAARTFKFGGGIELAVPANGLSYSSIGAGADLIGHYGLTDQFAITADVGYVGLFEKKDNSNAAIVGDVNIIPIRGGVRWYPIQHVYVSGRAGVGIRTGNTSDTYFAFALGGGYMVDTKLDLGIAYEGYNKGSNVGYLGGPYLYNSFGYIGIRLGYFFK